MNILGLVSHKVPAVATNFCHCNGKAAKGKLNVAVSQ